MDQSILVWIQNITPHSWDWFFSWFSILGRFEIITIFVVLFLWLTTKKINGLVLGLTWYGLGLIIEFLTKNLFTHPAPPLELNRTINILNLPSINIESDFSFPSGHVYRMTFLALISSFYFLKRKNYFAVAVTCFLLLIMFYSRVSLAEHWPSDVFGGLVLAFIMMKFTFSSFRRRFYNHPDGS